MKDWKFTRTMRYSGLQYTEMQMLRIVEGLGYKGQWGHACSVVEWLYDSKEHKHFKSRFVSRLFVSLQVLACCSFLNFDLLYLTLQV